MELVNALYGAEEKIVKGLVPASLLTEVQRDLALLLAPFAPYLSHELWEMLGEKGSLFRAPWPKYDAALAKEEEIEIPVQINGKLRGRIVVPAGAEDVAVLAAALADDKVKQRNCWKTDRKKDRGSGEIGKYRCEIVSR